VTGDATALHDGRDLIGVNIVVGGTGLDVRDARGFADAILGSAGAAELMAQGFPMAASVRDEHAVVTCFAPRDAVDEVRDALGDVDEALARATKGAGVDPVDLAIAQAFGRRETPGSELHARLVVVDGETVRVESVRSPGRPLLTGDRRDDGTRVVMLDEHAAPAAHVLVDLGAPPEIDDALAGSVLLAAAAGHRTALVTRAAADALGGGYDVRARLRLVDGREWLDLTMGIETPETAPRAVAAVVGTLRDMPRLVALPETIATARAHARSAYLFAGSSLPGVLDGATSFILRGLPASAFASASDRIGRIATARVVDRARALTQHPPRALVEGLAPSMLDDIELALH